MSRGSLTGPGTLLLALLACLGAAGAAAAGDPLTDEDVVRMFVAGRPAEEIVAGIEGSEPDFDLSPEMVEELRRAGLPREVLDAMSRRQREHDRLAARAAEQERIDSHPRLTIAFNPGREAAMVTVSVGRRIDPQLAAEWELGNAPEDREFADVAMFVTCETPEHVPDQWRSKSPLGRDFTIPRHKLLSFTSGQPAEEDLEPQGRRVALDVPASIEVPLEPGVAHDLSLGLALQIGGRYRTAARDVWPGVILEDGNIELQAIVRGRGPRKLKVSFEGREDPGADDDR